MLQLSSESHLFGETIVEHGFPDEYDELTGVLGGIDLPLRAAEPFTSKGAQRRPNDR